MSKVIMCIRGCGQEATYMWDREALCKDHAIDKREDLLIAILKKAADETNIVWINFYNSKYPAGDVDKPSKKA